MLNQRNLEEIQFLIDLLQYVISILSCWSMKGEVKRPDRMFFYKIGIGEKDFVNTKGWTIKTLTSIKAQLNHTKVL